ncbi:MAG: hypothetical protein K940chlam9_00178 [Chlamydiae bacterium]|nr:hypothetical protein [Chlamydiota bacterium]
MQIYAFSKTRVLIAAHDAHTGEDYLCSECQGRLRLREGKWRRPHFYHLKGSDCPSSGKSLIHLHTQYLIQKNLFPDPVFLEKPFPEIRRIADVAWPAKKIVFEIQYSPISAEEVRSRNLDYQKVGYQVVWILHDSRFNQHRLTEAELFLQTSPHYFTNINRFGEGIFYDQHAHISHNIRIGRSPRFAIRLQGLTPLKQVPRQLPEERKTWKIRIEGDLSYHLPLPSYKKKKRRRIPLIRLLYHSLLEKTTS